MLRFGVLAVIVAIFVDVTLDFPITADVSSWYFVTGLVVLGIVMAIALYGFHNSVHKQPMSGIQ